MIAAFIKGQAIEIDNPHIVSDTINYIQMQCVFMTADWKNLRIWAHFLQNEKEYYTVELDKNNITPYLHLPSGEWSVYLHGEQYENGAIVKRIVSDTAIFDVIQSAMRNGDPFPVIPNNEIEKIYALMGDLSNLHTNDKTSLVNAINEVLSKAGTGNGGDSDYVGIESIEQTVLSTESGGRNVVTITLTNGEQFDFEFYNGKQGKPYELTEKDKSDIKDAVIAEIPEGGDVDLTGYAKLEDVPTKTSDLDNDSGFITKADIPTDESYELIGQTPLTLENGGNIKLVADGETSYEMKTPTVWRFDKSEYTLSNCSIDTSKGYYEIAITKADITGYSQAYVEIILTGLEAGREYTIYPNVDGLPYNPDEYKWNGQVTAWDGETSKVSLLFSGQGLHSGAKSFVPSTDKVLLRFYVAKNIQPYNEWIATFNNFYINYADASEKLTDIYNNSGVFADVETFKAIPSGTTITTDPIARVYRKAPTDKTLTQSNVPADAEVTGKEITEVKSFLPLYGKTIVNFGDSIFGNARPPKDVSTFLAKKTGAEVLNCAFGGCRMGTHTGHWDAFSMYRLAYAIANNDYSLQDDALNYDDRVSYAEEPLALIKSTDFSTVDILTIGYGTNDFTGGNALDNDENPLDTSTLGGALRYSIETLLTAFPNLRIFILSATWRFWKDDNNEYTEDSKTYLNKLSKTLSEYNAKLKEVAEEYNLPFIDNYNIGIGKFNRYHYFPVTDGTHHNETGRKLIASHLAKELY